MAADDRLLGVALAPVRQTFAFAGTNALDDFFHDAFGDNRRAHRLGLRNELVDVVLIVFDLQHLRRQGLRQFGAVSVERICLQSELP